MTDIKILIFSIMTFVIGMWIGQLAHGQLNSVQSAGIPEFNMMTLKNPGAENDSQFWTASGGTFTGTSTAANVGAGNKAFSWDSNAAAQTLTETINTIPAGLLSRNAIISCNFKCNTGTCTHTLGAWDGSSLIASGTINSSNTYRRTNINFTMPASGSLGVRITSVNANEPLLFIDQCTIAAAEGFNVSEVGQNTIVATGYFETTASCTWTRASATIGAFGTTAACPGPSIDYSGTGPWSLQTTDTDLPKFTINNLPPGTYEVIFRGRNTGSAATDNNIFAINDGTTTANLRGAGSGQNNGQGGFIAFGIFTYTVAGNRTFELYGAQSGGSTMTVNNATTNDRTSFLVKRFPTTTDTAFRADVFPQSWSGYHDNTCSWARTNTAYGDPTADASCVLTQRFNQNFGTVTTSGAALPGIIFTPPAPSVYFVCAALKFTGATTAAFLDFRLWDGTTTIAEAEDQQKISTTLGASATQQLTLCGIYNATSATATTISLQSKASSGAVTITPNSTNASAVEWSIVNVSKAMNFPQLVGSVTSNTSGLERLERSSIASGGTISSQSGTWLSVSAHATGTYTWTTSGLASGFVCMCNLSGDSIGKCVADSYGTNTFRTLTRNSANTLTDTAHEIICMGPKQ